MINSKFKKIAVFATILFLYPMVSPDSLALARRRSPPKAYSFFMEGGKASQEECDGERKIPRKLKRHKEYTKTGSYLGSEIQTFEIKGKEDLEMWKHFFKSKSSCNAVLAKTPSSVNSSLKETKQELPPDEAADADDDDDQPEGQQEGPEAPPQ